MLVIHQSFPESNKKWGTTSRSDLPTMSLVEIKVGNCVLGGTTFPDFNCEFIVATVGVAIYRMFSISSQQKTE